jgi:hypothetical protein
MEEIIIEDLTMKIFPINWVIKFGLIFNHKFLKIQLIM